MPFLEEEFQLLKDPTKLADEGLLCFEAEEAPLSTSSSIPLGGRQSFCPTVCKKDKGKVIFFLEELPLRKRFLTKSGCLLERISYRFVSLGTGNI
jgi:hypothetical protein